MEINFLELIINNDNKLYQILKIFKNINLYKYLLNI